MRKGKYGVALVFYAMAAFMMAMVGQTLGLLLLTVFVIAVEKDEWAGRQCVQACGLLGLGWIVGKAIYILELPFTWIGRLITDYNSGFFKFSDVYRKIIDYCDEIIDIILLLFAIMAIFKVIKEQDAGVPIVSKLANWAYGNGGKKRCPNCGAEAEGSFCDKCGAKL